MARDEAEHVERSVEDLSTSNCKTPQEDKCNGNVAFARPTGFAMRQKQHEKIVVKSRDTQNDSTSLQTKVRSLKKYRTKKHAVKPSAAELRSTSSER